MRFVPPSVTSIIFRELDLARRTLCRFSLPFLLLYLLLSFCIAVNTNAANSFDNSVSSANVNGLRFERHTDQRIIDMYTSGVNETLYERARFSPLKEALKLIKNIKAPVDVMRVLAQFHMMGVSCAFSVSVHPREDGTLQLYLSHSMFGLPVFIYDYLHSRYNRNSSITANKAFEELTKELQEYIHHVSKVLRVEHKMATGIVALEIRMVEAEHTIMEEKVSFEDLNESFKVYLEGIGFKSSATDYIYIHPQIVAIVEKELISETREPLIVWSHYLLWSLFRTSSPFLKKDLVKVHGKFFDRKLSHEAEEPRWAMVWTEIGKELRSNVHILDAEKKMLVKQFQVRVRIVQHYLGEALQTLLNSKEWTDNRVYKLEILEKLKHFKLDVGVLKANEDDSGARVDPNKHFLLNKWAFTKWRFQRAMNILGKLPAYDGSKIDFHVLGYVKGANNAGPESILQSPYKRAPKTFVNASGSNSTSSHTIDWSFSDIFVFRVSAEGSLESRRDAAWDFGVIAFEVARWMTNAFDLEKIVDANLVKTWFENFKSRAGSKELDVDLQAVIQEMSVLKLASLAFLAYQKQNPHLEELREDSFVHSFSSLLSQRFGADDAEFFVQQASLSLHSSHDPGDSPPCTICFDPVFPGHGIFTAPCQHQFHCECIKPWKSISNSCPNCRVSMAFDWEHLIGSDDNRLNSLC